MVLLFSAQILRHSVRLREEGGLMDIDLFELLQDGRLAACRDPQLLEHMLPQLPVTVRLVRVEARQQERAVLPEDARVVLITLNKTGRSKSNGRISRVKALFSF